MCEYIAIFVIGIVIGIIIGVKIDDNTKIELSGKAKIKGDGNKLDTQGIFNLNKTKQNRFFKRIKIGGKNAMDF